jgi:hypothetical protein
MGVLAALATTICVPSRTSAQEIETGTVPASKDTSAISEALYGGAAFFMGGGIFTNQKPINDAFAARGYPQVSSSLVTLGSGGYFRINRLLLGGEGYWTVKRSSSSPTFDTSVSGGMGFLDVGYIVGRWGNLALFPMLALGGGGITYTVVPKGSGSFDQVLDTPTRGASLTTGGFIGQLMIGTDYLFNSSTKPDEVRGPLLGVRIGYALPLTHGGWSLFGSNVDGGPSVSLGGPFVRLVFGGGGMIAE